MYILNAPESCLWITASRFLRIPYFSRIRSVFPKYFEITVQLIYTLTVEISVQFLEISWHLSLLTGKDLWNVFRAPVFSDRGSRASLLQQTDGRIVPDVLMSVCWKLLR